MEGYQSQQALSLDDWNAKQVYEQKNRMANLETRMHQAEERLRQLETHVHYPNRMLEMREAAVKAQALPDTAPMRSDVETIMKLRAFVERFASDGDLRYKVPYDVNRMADEALGRK